VADRNSSLTETVAKQSENNAGKYSHDCGLQQEVSLLGILTKPFPMQRSCMCLVGGAAIDLLNLYA